VGLISNLLEDKQSFSVGELIGVEFIYVLIVISVAFVSILCEAPILLRYNRPDDSSGCRPI
jgi:hypothetical protein